MWRQAFGGLCFFEAAAAGFRGEFGEDVTRFDVGAFVKGHGADATGIEGGDVEAVEFESAVGLGDALGQGVALAVVIKIGACGEGGGQGGQ